MCGNWCRRRGAPAGAWSIAAIDLKNAIPGVQSPGLLAGAFSLLDPLRWNCPIFALSAYDCRRGVETNSPQTTYLHTRGKLDNSEHVMSNQTADNSEQIDRKTSRSICDAIGERLQKSFRPDTSGLSSYLQHLMDELRLRDRSSS
jgi:hypothetical protein